MRELVKNLASEFCPITTGSGRIRLNMALYRPSLPCSRPNPVRSRRTLSRFRNRPTLTGVLALSRLCRIFGHLGKRTKVFLESLLRSLVYSFPGHVVASRSWCAALARASPRPHRVCRRTLHRVLACSMRFHRPRRGGDGSVFLFGHRFAHRSEGRSCGREVKRLHIVEHVGTFRISGPWVNLQEC